VFAVERGSQFLNAVYVDDGRTVHPHEQARIQLRFEPVHRLSNEVRLSADVQADVVASRLAPVDVRDLDEVDAPARLDDEPFARGDRSGRRRRSRGRRLCIWQQAEDMAPDGGRPTLGQVLAREGERGAEALGAKRLQQIVERVDLERR